MGRRSTWKDSPMIALKILWKTGVSIAEALLGRPAGCSGAAEGLIGARSGFPQGLIRDVGGVYLERIDKGGEELLGGTKIVVIRGRGEG